MSATLTPEFLIRHLSLTPHPEEGGYFRETWRSGETVSNAPVRYIGPRNFGTAIYYLLTPDTRSALHRLASDEVFHFYLGDAVEMLNLLPDGTAARIVLGPDIAAGQCVQHIVPQGVWQGARLQPGGRFALLGCTVAPGFDYADYEHARRSELLSGWPAATDFITLLAD